MPLASVKVSCKGRLLAMPNADDADFGNDGEEERAYFIFVTFFTQPQFEARKFYT